jgi:hypothetical protein
MKYKEAMDNIRFCFFFSLSSVIIDEAKEKFEKRSAEESENDQGILFKLLQKDKRFATVMAFDMIFGGIDTVCG